MDALQEKPYFDHFIWLGLRVLRIVINAGPSEILVKISQCKAFPRMQPQCPQYSKSPLGFGYEDESFRDSRDNRVLTFIITKNPPLGINTQVFIQCCLVQAWSLEAQSTCHSTSWHKCCPTLWWKKKSNSFDLTFSGYLLRFIFPNVNRFCFLLIISWCQYKNQGGFQYLLFFSFWKLYFLF